MRHMLSVVLDVLTYHPMYIALPIGVFCIACKIHIVRTCKDHPHYIGKDK